MSDWEDIGDILTPKAKARLKRGHVLVFEREDGKHFYKVTMMSHNGRVWVREVPPIVSGDEMLEHNGHQIDATNEAVKEHGNPFCIDCQKVVGG